MTQLLQNAAYGTALILAVVLLRRVLKERLLPEARLALWAVCLFRLLTPTAPESVLSLWGLSRLLAPQKQPAPTPDVSGYVPAVGTAPPAPASQPDPGIPWETVLLALWLAVGAVLAVRYMLAWTRTRRAVACAILLDRDDPRYTALPRFARLREGSMKGAPLTFGAFWPTVVLPPGLSGTELDCVLAHEGVHARRRDNLWHYIMALALVVHWWNPVVWLMPRLLRRDIELSCDRAAVKRLGEDRRAEYAQTLVSLATQADGPAFCHTFGRKAAEERILSIMKFKKTSIIGVIFTLALVVAVTAAFASEPKKPDDTVVYQGRAYNRADLSQGTLDWLDWYLSLSEEGQMAVDFEPAELHAPDAYDNVKTDSSTTVQVPNLEKTKEIQSDFPTVDPDDVDLSMLKERLAKEVADGELTQAEADAELAATERMLEDARRGELKLFMHTDGSIFGSGIFDVYTRDENGNLIYNDSFVIDSAPAGQPYEEYFLGELQGEGSIQYDVVDYDVKLPTYDEDGNSEVDGIIGQKMMELDEYKALLDGLVANAKMTQDDADHFYSGAKQALEKGTEATALYANETGSYAIMTAPLCYLPDCQDHTPHSHGTMRYSGHIPVPCAQMDCKNDCSHLHDGVLYEGTLAVCTLDNCGNNCVHSHNGVTYKGWTGKLPAVVVNTQAPAVNTPAPAYQEVPGICPVSGCTISGGHTHDGVYYECNGYHSGGHCDGSCATSNSLPQYVNNSGHHGSSSHHSSGHH